MSDCRTEEGVIVGLIDGMIAQARVVARYLRSHAPSPEIAEALADVRADEDVAAVSAGGDHTPGSTKGSEQ